MEVDVVAPIRKCKQLGYKDAKIVIDVILNSGR